MSNVKVIGESRERRLRAACAELDSRLRAGEAVRAEDYLGETDDSVADDEFALELIYAEVAARERRGEPLRHDEWYERFPQWRDSLARLFELHELAKDTERLKSGFAAGTPDGLAVAAETPTDWSPYLADGKNLVGSRIGQYELLEEIGRGGMGIVYKARQLGLDRIVAIKMVLAHHATWQMRTRFRQEAETVARLHHPNIVQIHEVGEQNGCSYLSMEFVNGKTLDRELLQSPRPARAAAELVETLARAIDYAHGLGIVHRDLKPANVLLSSDGVPKITDFGLAKLLSSASSRSTDCTPADAGMTGGDLTATGQILGTPSYMAPEQATGKSDEIGPAADVYALGTILYEALCGRAPFRGVTPLDTLEQVRSHDPLPPRRLQPKLPRDLETICLKCLAKEPRRRYPSAKHLADDLRHFLVGEPIDARPVAWWERVGKWTRRRPAAAALILAIAVGFAGVTWQWLRAEASREDAVIEANAARISRTAAVHAAETAEEARQAESKERDRVERLLYAHDIALAFHENSAHNSHHALQLLDGTRPDLRHWEWRLLNRLCRAELFSLSGHSQAIYALTFSPDGSLLASASEARGDKPGEVRVWDTKAGVERFLLPAYPTGFTATTVAFSPDSTRLATTGSPQDAGVSVWDMADGRELLTVQKAGHVFSLAFSPDGGLLACGRNNGTILFIDSSSGAVVRTLSVSNRNVFGVAFSPTGTRLVAGQGDGTATIWDVSDGRRVDSISGLNDVRCLAYSPDGRHLAIGTWPGFVKIFELTEDGARKRSDDGTYRVTSHPRTAPIRQLSWRPDGQILAVVTGGQGVELLDVGTGQQRRVIHGEHFTAAYSPDSRRVATGGFDRLVRIWDLTTEPPPRSAFGHPTGAIIADMAFSPDGRHLAIAAGGASSGNPRSRDDRSLRLWDVVKQRTTKEFKGHKGWLTGVAFSRDGQRLATSSDDKTVRLWDAVGGEAIHTLEGHTAAVTCVAFGPDGTRVVSAGKDKTVRIWDATDGQEIRTLHGHAAEIRCVAFHADGRSVVSADTDGTIRLWDSTSGASLREWRGHTAAVNDLEFAQAGLLASCGDDGMIQLWDIAALRAGNDEPMRTMRGAVGQVTSISFTSDGRRIVSTGYPRAVKLWDVETGQELFGIRTDTNLVSHIRFSPDSRLLVLSHNRVLKTWDVGDNAPMEQGARDPSSMLQLVAWYTEQAQICESAGSAFGLTFHRRQLASLDLAAAPLADWRDLAGRGDAYIRLEQWDEAAADFDRAAVPDADLRIWARRAFLRLRSDDALGYRAACADLIHAFDESPTITNANNVAWTCLIASESGVDPGRLLRLAQQGVAQRRTKESLNTLGVAFYRAGRHPDAIKQLTAAIALHGDGGTPYDWLFLAMAHHAHGHADEARQWFDRAAQWIDRTTQQLAAGVVEPSFGWQNQIELRILRREAEGLLRM